MNIFKKLLLTYIGIVLVSMTILALLMSFLFEDFYFNEQQTALITHGRHVNNLILKLETGQVNKDQVMFNLVSLDRFLNARIVVLDKAGAVEFDSRVFEAKWQGAILKPVDLKKVLSGQIITVRGIAGSQFDTSTLTVALPLLINEQVDGIILMNAPVFGISTSLKQVYRLFFIGSLIAALLALLLSYHVSMMATKPLLKINEAALEMAKGKLDTVVEVTSRDEIGQLAQNFNYMASELNKIESARREFVANVSHELRSPLTSIRGFIQAMLDGTIPQEKQAKYLGVVFEETNRLNRLVNELLDLASIESESFKTEPADFDLYALMRQIGLRFFPLTSPKNITVETPSEGQLKVFADRDRVEQIIVNFTDNAVRFTPDGGKISLFTEENEGKIWVHIRDTGVGIPEDDLPYIWKRFHKADKARTRGKSGTGLGLSIVKRLIDAFGEEVMVTSIEGEGTEFVFSLPKSKEA